MGVSCGQHRPHAHPSHALQQVRVRVRVRTLTLTLTLTLTRCDPAYVLLVLGYAAYTFTIIGISGFGPQFFLGS